VVVVTRFVYCQRAKMKGTNKFRLRTTGEI